MRIHGHMTMPVQIPPANTVKTNAEMQLRAQVAQAKSGLLRSSGSGTLGAGGDENHAQLVKAANSFEATLMQELMKPLTKKDAIYSENGSDSGDDEDGGVMEGYATESLAQSLAASGGLGISKMVVKQVERQAGKTGHSDPTKVSKKILIHD
jgi:peptidoglycan hydrolase FlgJ